jgi:hypothetical protein
VIISYPAPQKFGGGIVTTSGSNVIHTFQTSGTLAPLSSLTAQYLIVAGGGGSSGYYSAGGGAGGLLSGSGLTIDTNSTYLVTVGAGGVGVTYAVVAGQGGNSAFSMVTTTAIGGGVGATSGASAGSALNGGSGGGAIYNAATTNGTGTSGQGNAGGIVTNFAALAVGGGGGGAGAVGGNANAGVAGNGGNGIASSISGTSTYYAGGGGGGCEASATPGSGGLGGGGAGHGSTASGGNGGSGTANTGGGGGGTGYAPSGTNVGGSGGSGIVIISYPGSTQQMAGGTVTISGGNVIHTFTSSGYLTPLKLVNNSLRLRGSTTSAYLNRTPSVSGNTQKWTWSGWFKGTNSSTNINTLFSASTSSSNYARLGFYNKYFWFINYNGGNSINLSTNNISFADPAAWYHVVVSVDTTQATSTNRVLIYINGVQIPSSLFVNNTYPSQNFNTLINSNILHQVGTSADYSSNYLDGYLTELNYIDGQQLTPNSFGTFNSYGVWQPITYGGSYGTNGFYLPFNKIDNSITIGYDQSPNGNHFTSSGISVLATNPTITTITSSQSWTAPAGVTAINYLLVGGGGGGGSDNQWGTGGYGGNGGYVQYYSTTVTPGQSYSLVVGNGGSAAGSGGAGGTGGTTSGFGNSVSGGGGGAGVNTNNRRTGVGGYGASVNAYNSYNGGNGAYYPTTANYYAGGGGGRSIGGTAGIGGLGGGGNFQIAGTPNTGGGGGAGGGEGGYAGGSGVIIISYGTATPVAANTTVGNVQDSMLDVPTLTNANTANYCTYNPLNRSPGLSGYITDGNLNVSNAGVGASWNGGISGTIGVSTGKWYYECYPTGHTTNSAGVVGWAQATIPMTTDQSAYNSQVGGFFIRNDVAGGNQQYLNFSTNTIISASAYANEILGIAVDFTSGKFWVSKNGAWITGDPGAGTTPLFTFTPSGYYLPYVAAIRSDIATNTYPINFGQQPFQYTVPNGFLALNTYNI